MLNNRGVQFLIAIIGNIVAAVMCPYLPKWFAITLMVITISLAFMVITKSLISKIKERMKQHLIRSIQEERPWEKFSKDAGSDDPETAIQAIDKAIEFIRQNPDFCLSTFDSLHKKARPDMSRRIEVRQKYASFRMYVNGIMVQGHPDLIGFIVSTLEYLLSSRWDDVRACATTELGQLCRFAADTNTPLTKNWRNICFDLLDKTLVEFFSHNWTHNLQSLIPHASSSIHSPEIFKEIFSHIVSNVVNRDGCKPDYIDVVCGLIANVLPDMVQYISSEDIKTLIGCSNLHHNLNLRMSTDGYLKLFDDIGNGHRIWRRLHIGDHISSINITCTGLDAKTCSCSATDISLKGICSQQCDKNCGVELSAVKAILDINGIAKEFYFPKAKVAREFKNRNGNRIEGAGIEIIDWGQNLRPLSDIIIERC